MWLETVILIEAAAAFWLAALNVTLLLRLASAARRPPRRAAALVLAAVCGGHWLEALLFLWTGEAETARGWPAAALMLVRTALLASMALISLLLARGLSPRR